MVELQTLNELIEALSSLPTIGKKSAERLAYSLLDMDEEKVNRIIDSIKTARSSIHPCPNCGALIDKETCPYCQVETRNHDTCIVVSYPKDVFIFNQLEDYKGQYHVLNGEISSLKGKTIDDLRVKELEKRVKDEEIKELILATNPTLDGEVTSLYIAKIIQEDFPSIKVTRLAKGIPFNTSLEYSDNLTLQNALDNRKDIK